MAIILIAALLGVLTAAIVPLQAVVQVVTPDRLRGRVIAMLTVFYLLAVFGFDYLRVYALDLVGARPTYFLAGLIVLVVGVGILSVKEIRMARLVAS